jgi:hypothetical protein
MYRDEIVRDLLDFVLNSGVDPESMLYKKAMLALYCVESDDIINVED